MDAWLTPDLPVSTVGQVAISWPDDPIYRALLMGAILLLSQEENWQEYGTATPAEMAQFFGNLMDTIYGEVP